VAAVTPRARQHCCYASRHAPAFRALLAFAAAVAWPVWMAAGVVRLSSAFWFSRRGEDDRPAADRPDRPCRPLRRGRHPIRELQESVDELTRLRAASLESAQRATSSSPRSRTSSAAR
jgi:hypothetical protein